MTHQEILQKAIEKGLANGWKPRDYPAYGLPSENIMSFELWKRGTKKATFFTEDGITFHLPVYEVIFSHEFAKALWGEEPSGQINVNPNINSEHFRKLGVQNWQVYLQQMVLASDPIQYLGEHLPRSRQ